MKKITLLALVLVMVLVFAGCGTKDIEKIPSLETIITMDEGGINSVLPGYTIDQLKEAWGAQNDSSVNESVWYLNETRLIVNNNWLGKVVVCGLEEATTDETLMDYGSAHLQIDKAVIVDIPSSNSIVVEIMNEVEHVKDEYSLDNGEIVFAIFSEDNQRAIDLIGTLHIGSIVNISRYDTTKPQDTTPNMTLECTGIDIYDEKGEIIVEYF